MRQRRMQGREDGDEKQRCSELHDSSFHGPVRYCATGLEPQRSLGTVWFSYAGNSMSCVM
jgi:hypothetical protein